MSLDGQPAGGVNEPQAGPGRLPEEMVRWVLVSVVSFAGNLAVTVGGTELLGLRPPVSFGLALVLVQSWNFVAIRGYIFGYGHVPLGRQAVRYVVLALAFRGLEWISFQSIYAIGTVDYRVLVVFVLSASSLLKFFAYRQWLGPSIRP